MKKFKTIDDFNLTQKQLRAVDGVEKALQRAREAGLHILAKQWNLGFFRKEVYDNEWNNSLHLPYNDGVQIPKAYIADCLDDSGADDPEYFKKGIFDYNGNFKPHKR